jgi:hypothetical protein
MKQAYAVLKAPNFLLKRVSKLFFGGFVGKGGGAQPSLWDGLQAARVTITISGTCIPNILNYCAVFMVCVYMYTHTYIHTYIHTQTLHTRPRDT